MTNIATHYVSLNFFMSNATNRSIQLCKKCSKELFFGVYLFMGSFYDKAWILGFRNSLSFGRKLLPRLSLFQTWVNMTKTSRVWRKTYEQNFLLQHLVKISLIRSVRTEEFYVQTQMCCYVFIF